MVMLMLVVELPLAFVAVMLYHVVVLRTVGVPQIVPLFVPKFRPDGSDGEIDQWDCPLLTWHRRALQVLELFARRAGESAR